MSAPRNLPGGFILLEVLVTIVILVFGLLGLAGFQLRATAAENEAYQRVQALILVQDMVDRIYANRAAAATYSAYAQPIGTGDSEPDPTACAAITARLARDMCEWSNALKGASEELGGASVGAMIGGRGCITAGAANEYIVTVVWQGLVPTVAPAGTACGVNLYSTDTLRRAVSMRVVISNLTAP